VRKIEVRGGQFVEQDAILLVLENEELQVRLADFETQIEQSLIRSRQYEKQQELAAYQAELANRETLVNSGMSCATRWPS